MHYSTSEMENDIQNKWGYDIYFNSFSSKSRGVTIFLNNNFELKVHKKCLMKQVIY